MAQLGVWRILLSNSFPPSSLFHCPCLFQSPRRRTPTRRPSAARMDASPQAELQGLACQCHGSLGHHGVRVRRWRLLFFFFFFIVSKVFYSFIFHVFSCCPVSFSLSLLFFPVLEKRFSLFPPLLLSFPCPPPHPPPPQRLCGHHQAAAQAGDLSVWRGLVPDQLRSEVSRRFRSNNATRSCFSPRSPPTSPAQSQRHPRPLGAALCDGADSRMRHVADLHPLRQSGAAPLCRYLL